MFNSIWYQNLTHPPLTPPSAVFAPVWLILYLLIFSSLAIYIVKREENKELGYLYFTIQSFLNIIWAPIFFSSKNILLAFIIIVLLDIFVFLTIKKFHEISKTASFALIPYFVWILFATYLNLGYLILN